MLFSEAAVYLADYKDIFFALIVCAVFLGEYLQSKTQEAKKYYPHSEVLALSLGSVLFGFLLFTLTLNFRSVFYLKHDVLVQSLHEATSYAQYKRNKNENLNTEEEVTIRASSFLTGHTHVT